MKAILALPFRGEPEWIAAVDCVRHAAPDDEIAHGMQDDLLRRALQDIAGGMPGTDAQAVAQRVLEVFSIEFSRWCV